MNKIHASLFVVKCVLQILEILPKHIRIAKSCFKFKTALYPFCFVNVLWSFLSYSHCWINCAILDVFLQNKYLLLWANYFYMCLISYLFLESLLHFHWQENPDLWKWLSGQDQPPAAVSVNPVSQINTYIPDVVAFHSLLLCYINLAYLSVCQRYPCFEGICSCS